MDDSKPKLFRPGIGKRGMTEVHYAAYCGDLSALLRSLHARMDGQCHRRLSKLHADALVGRHGGDRWSSHRDAESTGGTWSGHQYADGRWDDGFDACACHR